MASSRRSQRSNKSDGKSRRSSRRLAVESDTRSEKSSSRSQHQAAQKPLGENSARRPVASESAPVKTGNPPPQTGSGKQKRPQSIREAAQMASQKTASQKLVVQQKKTAQKTAQKVAPSSSRSSRKPVQSKQTQASQKQTEIPSGRQQKSSSQSSKRQIASGTRQRSSGRISSRMETKNSTKVPMIIAAFIVIGLVVGGAFLSQSDSLRQELNVLIADYQSAHKSMKSALRDGNVDKAEKYYSTADTAIDRIQSYVAVHQGDLESTPDTTAQQLAIDELKASLPLIAKKAQIRKAGSRLQVKLNQIKRVHDLDGLLTEVTRFLNNPLPSDNQLSASDKQLLLGGVGYLNDAGKTVAEEKQRRKKVYQLHPIQADSRNDAQKRVERKSLPAFKKSVANALKKNKFGTAYKGVIARNKKYPSSDVSEQWQAIEEKEKSTWASCAAACDSDIQTGAQKTLAQAQSALHAFIDANGKEQYVSQARALLQSCNAALEALK